MLSCDAIYLVGQRWIFLILSILGLRQWLVRIMPQSLVLAVGAGIGLFIASVIPPPSVFGIQINFASLQIYRSL